MSDNKNQQSGLRRYSEQRKKETEIKVRKTLDKMKREGRDINYEAVAKEAGVSRATLYNNSDLREEIALIKNEEVERKKKQLVKEEDKIKCHDSKIAELRSIITKLEIDKKNLIVQLVQMEHLKDENELLKKRMNIKTVYGQPQDGWGTVSLATNTTFGMDISNAVRWFIPFNNQIIKG